MTTQERFMRHVHPEPNTGCWLWGGATRRDGYGFFNTPKAKIRTPSAHRVSWELHRGEIPSGHGYHGVCVLHRCDNKLCVNPDHLFLGSQADNLADMKAKGRQQRGDTHWAKGCGRWCGNGKLSDERVASIRAERAAGDSLYAIAKRHDVTPSTVHYIVTGKTHRS